MASPVPNNLYVIENDAQFSTRLSEAGVKLVVIDFFATWCGPCKNIAPYVTQYAAKYPEANFFKVDVDKCKTTQDTYKVTAMPTFVFVKNGRTVAEFKGADPKKLEDTIKMHYSVESEGGGSSGVPGYIDLLSLINKSQVECLNESDDHPLSHCLTTGGQYLESDCDEQLIISVAFQSNVKLHSLKIHGPENNAPKTVKIFINQPSTLDFDKAERGEAVQTLILTNEDVAKDAIIPLKFVKFQNVQNITLFVQDNLGDEEVTHIDFLSFIGAEIGNSTNMGEFKRVAGKKGESH